MKISTPQNIMISQYFALVPTCVHCRAFTFVWYNQHYLCGFSSSIPGSI